MARALRPDYPPGRLPFTSALSFDGAELQELRDRESIRNLVLRFALCIDYRDWDAFAACFTPMVSVKLDERTAASPPAPVPVDLWKEVAKASFAPYDSTHHLVQPYSIELTGEKGQAISYFQASHYRANPDGAPTFVQKGMYHHRFERTTAGWRISGWEQTVRWGSGNRAVLDRAMDEMPRKLLWGG